MAKVKVFAHAVFDGFWFGSMVLVVAHVVEGFLFGSVVVAAHVVEGFLFGVVDVAAHAVVE